MMKPKVCRWGILGTAQIARKNWQAIRNAENCSLTAVASRDYQRARRFVKECQSQVPMDPPPRCFGSYEELVASDAVDALYIPLPTGLRKPWVIRAADAGKHVLVEKPAGITAGDVSDNLDACRRNGVQFMDGVMFMHSRRLDRMREVLDDGRSVGPIKRIATQFSFGASDEFFAGDIRAHSELEPLGCLGDLGWYNIRFTLWAMHWKLPGRVCAHVLTSRSRPDSPASVPSDFSAELFYDDGVSASFYCSFLAENQQWASISGTKGQLYVPDFVLPYYGSEASFTVLDDVFQVTGCAFNMEHHPRQFAVNEYSNNAVNAQETNMFRRFAELVISGQTDPWWGEISLETQQVLDACLRSSRCDGQIVGLDA